MSLVFLVGMPGVGKSYWGRVLAAAYNIPVVDMDEYIEQQEGATIAQIFEHKGETAFRELERRALEEIIRDTDRAIIACGGGTPCYLGNMELMKQKGEVVYLRSSIPVLVAHLQHEAHKRPLLTGKELLDSYLHDMLGARASVYEKADHIVDLNNVSVATFAQIFNDV